VAFTATTANTEVRSLLNEATPSFWSDTEIDSWVAQGCLDWCEKSLLYLKQDTITLVTNQVQYTISGSSFIDNAIFTIHAEYNNIALQRITYEQLRGHNQMELSTATTPKYYYDRYNGTTFTFYIGPKPSVTFNGTNVTVMFAMRTDDIADIPYEYQQVVFQYAYSKAKIKERQFQEAALAWQQYINNINFARRDSLERSVMPTGAFRIQ